MAEAKAKKAGAKPKAAAEKKAEKKPAKPKARKPKPPAKKEAKGKAEAPKAVAEEKPAAEAAEGKAGKKPKEPKPRQPKPVVKIMFSGRGSLEESGKWKPEFRRQEYPKLARMDDKWRSCRGIDSKKAERKRGKGKLPCIGYGKPKGHSGIVDGWRPVLVHNPKELASVDGKTQAIVIAASVGRKKRNQVIEEANKLKLTVLNPRKGEK